ncbi:molybdopterin-dependent oxidoreductase [Actinomadura geliboluensis]|uniref:molybdopterin-dependent oxidoreductase n=1 Tax=Actinomadura geliboluensis TaxID=882440 RepID=UPI00372255A3
MTVEGHAPRTGLRICPLCEATCGLEFTLKGREVLSVRADGADVFSAGHSCAKGVGLKDLENDPDRLTTPLVRRDGELRPATWAEAFAVIAERLPPILERDRRAVAVYAGNPSAHTLDHALYLGSLLGALGTRNVFSPASLDTLPQNVVGILMYGTGLGLTVPDLDRTDFLLVLGSNPMVSNGSTVTAPGIHRRFSDLRKRGGRLVVVDPARTRTAEIADRHLAIRPGTDAYLLMAMLHVIAAEDLVRPGPAGDHADGVEDALAAAAGFPPEAVAGVVGVAAEEITGLAREFAAARRAVVHGRIGTCAQEFGTVTSWLIEVLNLVTGRLDAEGGAMFATPPAGGPNTWPGSMRDVIFDRWRSRVRGLPEAMGELPAVTMAEEILTPGPGQVRVLLTLAGNPARSVPNSMHVEAALDDLEFMVSLDTYLNETTRYADVVLPAPPLTTRGHYDIALTHFQVRNVARYSWPLQEAAEHELPEWKVLLRLAALIAGSTATVEEMDDEIAAQQARRAAKLAGVPESRATTSIEGLTGPERLVDLRLRSGPFGDRFGAEPGGLSLALLREHPHGVDCGPLRPRLPEVLRTPGGRIDAAPRRILDDVPRLRHRLADDWSGGLRLINRRQRRGMNSWLHNALPPADAGQCALLMHPADAGEHDLVDGERVTVTSAVASVVAELRVTDAVRPGVVSLPHGWGHDGGGLAMTRAPRFAGANVNALNDHLLVEPLTGMPIMTGVPVTVSPAAGQSIQEVP